MTTSSSTAETSNDSSKSKKKRRNSEGHESHKKKVRVDTTLAPEKVATSEKKALKAKSPKTYKTSTGTSSDKVAEDEGPAEAEDDAEAQSGDGSESDSSQVPVHESLTKKSKKSSRKHKFVPEAETAEQRDARTIFVGNLPAEIVKNRVRLTQITIVLYSGLIELP